MKTLFTTPPPEESHHSDALKAFSRKALDFLRPPKPLLIWGSVALFLGAASVLADHAGYIPHSQITPVIVGPNWMVGEYRDCAAWSNGDGSINVLGCPADVARELSAASEHKFTVRYWGRIVRPDVAKKLDLANDVFDPLWKWRCQRRDEKLVCWAVN